LGREAVCQCNWAGVTLAVKALLETSELIVRETNAGRGGLRKRIPFAGIKQAKAHPDRLTFTVGSDPVALFLGKDQSAKWAAAILAGPTPLAKKLGITAGSIVRAIGDVSDPDLAEAIAITAQISPRNPTLIVAVVETPADLASALGAARLQLARSIPIWLVYPKGPGHALSESIVRAAGLAAGLVDTKVASVSTRLTALRFNLRHEK
jgi:hypothetical protein